MSIAQHHAEWLSLIEVSGPFISMPVLMRVFPQGLDPRDSENAKELRIAYEEWLDKPDAPGRHNAWTVFVLKRLLNFPDDLIVEGQGLPAGLEATMAEYGEALKPDLAIIGPSGTSFAGKAHLLLQIYPPSQSLDSPVTGKHWKAAPSTRMMELLHASDVLLGLITNGEDWMLVCAPRGETTGYASWQAALWQDEPITLRAFHSLLQSRRFFGVADADTIAAMLKESAKDQQEVTDQLGYQVRRAVEVLVQAFDKLDVDSGRQLLLGLDEKNLFDAALTVMMRLVFLFSAEERGLLRLGDPLYDQNYAVSTLREQLRDIADHYGEEVLERRADAWSRLLATFRAVHGGVDHESLRLPAYGGTLFDPDRYPFLEGRALGSNWRQTASKPLLVNNRVVLHLLESLQILQVKIPGGGSAEARRLSFRALDIEQIGHVYEGLLDHTAVRARSIVLGLKGTKDKEPEIDLEKLEALVKLSTEQTIDFLKEATGRSAPAIRRDLQEPQIEDDHKLIICCGQDTKLRDRVRFFANLIRCDSFGNPAVFLKGSVYVTQGTTRRSTGTHYTPKILTEPIVQNTLEPLVYDGPAQGWQKDKWKLKSPREILAIKICDMAMGSGAFLVQADRYLAERLVEAWEDIEQIQSGSYLITPEGDVSSGNSSERLLPKDPFERLALARRIIADRCLYGIDINEMAVEMAKLSLWLVTLQRDRPFSFLDHALKSGDSLLGICRLKQLETFSLHDSQATQMMILSNYKELLSIASDKRRELENLPSNDSIQIAEKETLNIEVEGRLKHLKLTSDLIIAVALLDGTDEENERARIDTHLKVSEFMKGPIDLFQSYVKGRLRGRKTFHWPLEFPEVFQNGGFSAFIGNPPFLGGSRISTILGVDYLRYLQSFYSSSARADLCCYFFQRGFELTRSTGTIGLIATNTISQADSRDASLSYVLKNQGTIICAYPSKSWPGAAAVVVSLVHIYKGSYSGLRILNDKSVAEISSFLEEGEHLSEPYVLHAQRDKAFHGSVLVGNGFVISQEQAKSLIAENKADKAVLFPYINGLDINSSPNQMPSRWVINFFNWPLSKRAMPKGYKGPVAEDFPRCLQIVKQLVKPSRDKLGEKKDASAKGYARLWWQYGRRQDALYSAIKNMDQVIVRPRVSNTHAPVFLSTSYIFSDAVVVFVMDKFWQWGIIQSSLHEEWARKYCSTLKRDLRYSGTDAFETYAFPFNGKAIDSVAIEYYEFRQQLMNKLQIGLTALYNRFHDPEDKLTDISRLRLLHVKLDKAVAASYGWNDLDLGHDFQDVKHGRRYAISDSARIDVLDRLLELNHQRYNEEVAMGLHQKEMDKTKKRLKKAAADSSEGILTLFD